MHLFDNLSIKDETGIKMSISCLLHTYRPTVMTTHILFNVFYVHVLNTLKFVGLLCTRSTFYYKGFHFQNPSGSIVTSVRCRPNNIYYTLLDLTAHCTPPRWWQYVWQNRRPIQSTSANWKMYFTSCIYMFGASSSYFFNRVLICIVCFVLTEQSSTYWTTKRAARSVQTTTKSTQGMLQFDR